MSQECVVAVYPSLERAKHAVQTLESAGFSHDHVSLVTRSPADRVPDDEALQYGDQAERSAAKGAGVGGLIGALLGAPVMTIGGIGAVVIAGPIAMGLTGAIVGGLVGAMSGWGVHSDHVKEYEQRIADGSVLVMASGGPREVAEAEKILQEQTEPDELHLHAETSADSVEP